MTDLRTTLNQLEAEAAELQAEARAKGDLRTALAAVRERREIAVLRAAHDGDEDAGFACEARAEFERLKAEESQ